MEKMIKCLSHNAYRVSDMEASLKFYCDCLGLRKMFELKDDEGKDWIIYLMITEGQYLELFYGGEADFSIDMGKHICFEVEDMDKAVAHIKECGYRTLNDMKPVHGKDFNTECFVQDPDGNLIELMQFGPDALQLRGEWGAVYE